MVVTAGCRSRGRGFDSRIGTSFFHSFFFFSVSFFFPSCSLRHFNAQAFFGGASAASEATHSSCPLRFAVYVGG